MIDRVGTLLFSNIGTKLISVIIAMVLWIIVLGSRNVEETMEVPLEVITAADVVPFNEVPDKIAFRLSGPKAFLRTFLGRRQEPIRLNLAASKPGVVTQRIYSDNIRVPIGVKVLSISPPTITVKLEKVEKREVPVRVELRGLPAEGFRVSKTEVRPKNVIIKGARSRIETITEMPTMPVDVSDLKQSVEREASLDLSRYNVQLEGSIPKLSIEIEASSANFRIRGVEVRVLTSGLKSTIDEKEKTVTVLVRAAAKDLKSLDRTQVYAVIDLRGRPKGKYSEPVKVTVPRDVGLVKVIPEQFNVTLY